MRYLILIFCLLPFIGFSQIQLVGNITTFGGGSYPTHIDSLGYGGLTVVADSTERNAITQLRRKAGMVVFQVDNSTLYYLVAPITGNNWMPIESGDLITLDTAQTTIYCPAHGLDLTDYEGEFLPMFACRGARATHLDSLQTYYAVGTPDPDSITIISSGLIYRPNHALSNFIGKIVYLTNTVGAYDTIQGTVLSAIAVVIDSNYIDLLPRSVLESDRAMSVLILPASFLNAYLGDAKVPQDTAVQRLSRLYASVGLLRAGGKVITQTTAISDNPIYGSAGSNPVNPAMSWTWTGGVNGRVIKDKELVISIDLEDTAYGGLDITPLDTVVLVDGVPTDTTVFNWLEDNLTSRNLRLPNGSLLYFVGSGSRQNPDYIWSVIDDISGNVSGATRWSRLIKRIKEPGGGGATVTASNGLTKTSSNIELGGTLTENTSIGGAGTYDFDLSALDSLSLSFAKRLLISQNSQRFLHQTGGGAGGGVFENLFFGYQAGASALGTGQGYANTVIGRRAGYNLTLTSAGGLTTASSNVFLGYGSGEGCTNCTGNTFVGTASGSNSISTYANTYIGWHAGIYATGSYNTFIGREAGNSSTASETTSVGHSAGRNATGAQNAFYGAFAGEAGTTARRNAYFGHSAGQYLSSGSEENAFFGWRAGGGAANVSAGYNTCVGSETGFSLTSGNTNTFIGRNAGKAVTTGSGNVFVGNNANSTTTGSNNFLVSIGAAAFPTTTQSNSLLIGPDIYATGMYTGASFRMALGNGTFRNPNATLHVRAYTKSVNDTIFTAGNSTSGVSSFDNFFITADGRVVARQEVGSSTSGNPLAQFIGIYSATGSSNTGWGTMAVYPTINETTLDTTWGYRAQPTLTSASDFIGFWTNNNTNVGFASTGTATNYFRGNTGVGNGTYAPARTLHVGGELRVTDLITDSPTRLVGADADGDFSDAGSGVNGRNVYWTGPGTVGSEAGYEYDASINTLRTGKARIDSTANGDGLELAAFNSSNILTKVTFTGDTGINFDDGTLSLANNTESVADTTTRTHTSGEVHHETGYAEYGGNGFSYSTGGVVNASGASRNVKVRYYFDAQSTTGTVTLTTNIKIWNGSAYVALTRPKEGRITMTINDTELRRGSGEAIITLPNTQRVNISFNSSAGCSISNFKMVVEKI